MVVVGDFKRDIYNYFYFEIPLSLVLTVSSVVLSLAVIDMYSASSTAKYSFWYMALQCIQMARIVNIVYKKNMTYQHIHILKNIYLQSQITISVLYWYGVLLYTIKSQNNLYLSLHSLLHLHNLFICTIALMSSFLLPCVIAYWFSYYNILVATYLYQRGITDFPILSRAYNRYESSDSDDEDIRVMMTVLVSEDDHAADATSPAA